MIAEAVYLLCTLTSLLCAVLLARGYRRSRVPLLLWSAICFACFSINNALVFLDFVILPANDLSPIRALPAALGIILLCYGLIAEVVR